MRTFDDWFTDLISNHVWAGPAQLHHKPETFKSLCNKVYMDYLAGNGVKSMEDCRRHVYHLVCKTPTDNKVDWVAKGIEELKKKEGDKFNLKQFHEKFLSFGSAPVKYIRELMLSEG